MSAAIHRNSPHTLAASNNPMDSHTKVPSIKSEGKSTVLNPRVLPSPLYISPLMGLATMTLPLSAYLEAMCINLDIDIIARNLIFIMLSHESDRSYDENILVAIRPESREGDAAAIRYANSMHMRRHHLDNDANHCPPQTRHQQSTNLPNRKTRRTFQDPMRTRVNHSLHHHDRLDSRTPLKHPTTSPRITITATSPLNQIPLISPSPIPRPTRPTTSLPYCLR